jgi:hydrogenase maturation factor
MNLSYGQIVDAFNEDGLTMGRARFRGSMRKVTLGLLSEARRGEAVLVCDGIAIGKISDSTAQNKHYVPGNTR